MNYSNYSFLFIFLLFIPFINSCSDDDGFSAPTGAVVLDVETKKYFINDDFYGYIFISDSNGDFVDMKQFSNYSTVQLRSKNNQVAGFNASIVHILDYPDFKYRYIETYLDIPPGSITLDRIKFDDSLRADSKIIITETGGIYNDKDFVHPLTELFPPNAFIHTDPTTITFEMFDTAGVYCSYKSVDDGKVRYYLNNNYWPGKIDTINSTTLPIIENAITINFPSIKIDRVNLYASLNGSGGDFHKIARLQRDVIGSVEFYVPTNIIEKYHLTLDTYLSEKERLVTGHFFENLSDPVVQDFDLEIIQTSDFDHFFSTNSNISFFSVSYSWLKESEEKFTWTVHGGGDKDIGFNFPEIPKALLDQYPILQNELEYSSTSFEKFEPELSYTNYLDMQFDPTFENRHNYKDYYLKIFFK